MLILTRRPGQVFRIKPRPDLDQGRPLATLFGDDAIEIVVKQVRGNQVKIGIRAHPGLHIIRDEYKPPVAEATAEEWMTSEVPPLDTD